MSPPLSRRAWSRATKPLQYLLSLGLMALFLYWAFRGIDSASLITSLKSISPGWAGAIVLTSLATLGLRSWRWLALMRPFTRGVSIWDASLALAICYTSNVAIPRSGEAMRALSLNWSRGAPVGAVLATVVVERILDLIWLVLLVVASLWLLPDTLEAAFPWLTALSLAALAGCLAALVCLTLVSVYRDRALVLVSRLLGRVWPKLAAKATHLLETALHGLTSLHTPSAYLEIMVGSALLNLGYLFIIYESFCAFGLDQSYGLGLEAALVILAISSIGVVLPTPGGAGSYHLFFSQSLHLLYGVAQTPALACATGVHAIATLTYVFLGGPALFVQRLRYTRRKKNPAGPSAQA